MIRSTALFLALVPLAALGACVGTDPVTSRESNLDEVTPDCLGCMEQLTECTSTAKNEAQFVDCRDLFQACQDSMDLGPDECGKPTNRQACELCNERRDECTAGDCDTEFTVCKAFLMTGDQEACDSAPEPEQADCGACTEQLAACASSGDELAACQAAFTTCRDANGMTSETCGLPTEGVACEACYTQRTKCEAATGEGCDDAYTACETALVAPDACGSQGAGGGGGGPTGGTCEHDACEAGTALAAECSACVSEVCTTDSYCCEFSFDEYCVNIAKSVTSCGCASDTCSHAVCAAGDPLTEGCNECTSTVCADDDYCCTYEWDDLCVGKATELCGASCGG